MATPQLLSSGCQNGNRPNLLTQSPSATLAGELLVAFILNFATDNLTVSDNLGNVWTKLQSATFNSGAWTAWVFYSKVTVAGIPNVQVNVNSNTDWILNHYYSTVLS